MLKKKIAGIALAALVITSAIAVGPQYWNPDKIASQTVAHAIA
ncbi:hypothetical protein [Amycolatopsis sp. MtRt-6]|nr:hypothetical protein [Amycolatopsis sp. MtRt-6]